MAPIKVDPSKIHEFEDADAFYAWLGKHHNVEDEVWIKIHKVASGLKSITPVEAIDAALCWGWIDGVRKGFDEKSYLQRYTPRRPKSIWSRINVDNVERLIREGRMTEHGLRHVEAAKADGRWHRAYSSGKIWRSPMLCRQRLMPSPRQRRCWQSSARRIVSRLPSGFTI